VSSKIMDRLDGQIDEARGTLLRACAKRDKAIKVLIRSAEAITKAQQALARAEKRRAMARDRETLDRG